ncbi:glycosyltransferase family 10 protein [Backusella circina FSU 941]|nr:glycosyltransferase family 10 protein [Backusella circina FSU 941]
MFEKEEHPPKQPWILESLETPYSSPFRADNASMEPYDYLASYHFNSTFLFTYFSSHILDVVNRPLPKDFMKTKRAPVLWIARNCHATNTRQAYIEELMKYVEVHNYGSCLNTHAFPKDTSRTDLMREYKFYLAIENSNCDNYATEKLYDTFMNSAVPIVDGPDSYSGYIPTNRSVIYMDAYPDPRDLANYLTYLDHNDTAYLEYLSFRRDAVHMSMRERLDPVFIERWSDERALALTSDYCSICHGVLPWWRSRQDPSFELLPVEDKYDRFRVDTSCRASGKWEYVLNGPPYVPKWQPRPKDEFTRPVMMEVIDKIEDDDTISMASMVYIGFIGFFLLYVLFLWKQSRIKVKAQEPFV